MVTTDGTTKMAAGSLLAIKVGRTEQESWGTFRLLRAASQDDLLEATREVRATAPALTAETAVIDALRKSGIIEEATPHELIMDLSSADAPFLLLHVGTTPATADDPVQKASKLLEAFRSRRGVRGDGRDR